MGKRRKARILALQLSYQDDTGNRPLDEVFAAFWESQGAPAAETRQFAEELVRGVSAHREELDSHVRRSSANWDLDRMAVVDRNIIRLAVYELLHRDDIPPKVTINEFVEIAKKYSTEDSGSFVNGILDRIYREGAGSKGSPPGPTP